MIFSGEFKDLNFFKVKQVADIFNMTPRTIRNFIRNNELKAAKFGGEWRIKKSDLIDFAQKHFDENRDEMLRELNSSIKSFIDGNHMEIEGKLQICTIVDLYVEKGSKEKAEKIRNEVIEVVNTSTEKGTFKGEWHFIEEENKLRFVFWTDNPQRINKLMEPYKKI